MAWRSGCAAGGGVRDDFAADADEDPHCVYLDCGASARLHRDHPGESDSAEQDWARGRVSGFQRRVRGWFGEGVVLGWLDLSAVDLCR